MKTVNELPANISNPRKINEQRLVSLRMAMDEFGDLGAIVFNRKTKQLVSGHQRVKVLDDAEIVIEHKYAKPTKTGTVAEGYVICEGERFRYREVSWGVNREKAALIAANKSAGDWDNEKLKTIFDELSTDGFELSLTMFSELERNGIMGSAEEKPKKEKTRVASDGVTKISLVFNKAQAEEFQQLITVAQDRLGLESASDAILDVLRIALVRDKVFSTKLRKSSLHPN